MITREDVTRQLDRLVNEKKATFGYGVWTREFYSGDTRIEYSFDDNKLLIHEYERMRPSEFYQTRVTFDKALEKLRGL